MSTPNPEEKSRIVADAISKLSPTFRPDKTVDGEFILANAMHVAKTVNEKLKPLIEASNNTLGIKHDKKVLSSMISKAYLDGFGSWSKDELLYLLIFIHTQTAVESISGQTGNSGIITSL